MSFNIKLISLLSRSNYLKMLLYFDDLKNIKYSLKSSRIYWKSEYDQINSSILTLTFYLYLQYIKKFDNII